MIFGQKGVFEVYLFFARVIYFLILNHSNYPHILGANPVTCPVLTLGKLFAVDTTRCPNKNATLFSFISPSVLMLQFYSLTGQ